MPEIIIIGCPRSALRFIADTFTQAGLDVKHEQHGEDGIASWKRTNQEPPEGVLVLHQFRDPLATISSMQVISDNSWSYLIEETSAEESQDVVERGMRVYLDWNRLAEERADYSYRVEDIDNEWETLSGLAGVPGVPLPDVDREKNSRKQKYIPLLWSDLGERDIELSLEIAAYYGISDYRTIENVKL